MALTYAQVADIVAGRLNLGSRDKLRIQKSIADALQIFSERIATDENKRHFILTPRTVTGTPTAGILDLSALITSNRIMIDKLHWGRIYNDGNKTFTSANVDTSSDLVQIIDNGFVRGLEVTLTTTGTLPAPLALATGYYIGMTPFDDENFFWFATDQNDLEGTIINLTTGGTGTHTVVVPDSDPAPLQYLSNPHFTSFNQPWAAEGSQDKYWWLIGTMLYAFKANNTPITTALQFNVPHTAALAEFGTFAPLSQLQDEFIDVVTELYAGSLARRSNTNE